MISLLAGISDVKNAHISNQNLPNSFRDLGNLNSLEKISMKYNSKILPGIGQKQFMGLGFTDSSLTSQLIKDSIERQKYYIMQDYLLKNPLAPYTELSSPAV